MLNDAQMEAGEAIKGAQAAAREQERQAAVTYRAMYRQIIEDKRQEVQAELDKQSELRRQENQAVIKETRLDQAVDLIMQEVLADGHR